MTQLLVAHMKLTNSQINTKIWSLREQWVFSFTFGI